MERSGQTFRHCSQYRRTAIRPTSPWLPLRGDLDPGQQAWRGRRPDSYLQRHQPCLCALLLHLRTTRWTRLAPPLPHPYPRRADSRVCLPATASKTTRGQIESLDLTTAAVRAEGTHDGSLWRLQWCNGLKILSFPQRPQSLANARDVRTLWPAA